MFFSLLLILFIPSVSQTTETSEIFSVSQVKNDKPGSDSPVSWSLDLIETGIQSSLKVSLEKPEELTQLADNLGWEYRLEIDGITVLQEILTDPQMEVNKTIPLENVIDGKHIAILTLRDFEGKLHKQTIEFELNSSPKITATVLNPEAGIIDPEFTFSFLGESESFVGLVDIYLNTLSIETVNILQAQNNTPLKLSDLLGSPIYTADLVPGIHLLRIEARSINGSSSTHSLPINSNLSPPDIKVHLKNDDKLDSIDILFPKSSKKSIGKCEVHYNRSTILAVRSEKKSLSISRDDLVSAFKKHNLEIPDTQTTLILSASSANQVENWQTVSFR